MALRVVFALALAALIACAAHAAPQVTIPQGTLEGVASGDVASFKGIPYAAPPIGPLRWRPPAPAPAWTGVRQASAFGPACMQPGRPTATAADMSEDCLTLNIWAPSGLAPGAKAPVMVWIHGGAFVWGSGASPLYDGTHFAEQGIVVVTLNYRLGRFGFFAHPALTAEAAGAPTGNFGLMDQIAALKWVQANIGAFGGDAQAVTVAGESAGAISINYLMISPMAHGLFARAIVESGFARAAGQPIRGAADSAEATGARIAAALGVTGLAASGAAALRAIPAEKLDLAPSGLADPEIPRPIIDGLVAPETIAQGFAGGHEAKVPFLVGGNSWEASLVPTIAKDPAATLARAGPARDAVIALYGGPANLVKVAQDVTTDAMVTEPDRFQAAALTRDGQRVYVYHFAYVPAAQRTTVPGAAHGAEIMYAFDNLPAAPISFAGYNIPAATAFDRAVGKAMNAFWASFVARATPDSAGGAPWPRWTDQDGAVMVFGPDGPAPAADFEKARLDFLQAHARALPQ